MDFLKAIWRKIADLMGWNDEGPQQLGLNTNEALYPKRKTPQAIPINTNRVSTPQIKNSQPTPARGKAQKSGGAAKRKDQLTHAAQARLGALEPEAPHIDDDVEQPKFELMGDGPAPAPAPEPVKKWTPKRAMESVFEPEHEMTPVPVIEPAFAPSIEPAFAAPTIEPALDPIPEPVMAPVAEPAIAEPVVEPVAEASAFPELESAATDEILELPSVQFEAPPILAEAYEANEHDIAVAEEVHESVPPALPVKPVPPAAKPAPQVKPSAKPIQNAKPAPVKPAPSAPVQNSKPAPPVQAAQPTAPSQPVAAVTPPPVQTPAPSVQPVNEVKTPAQAKYNPTNPNEHTAQRLARLLVSEIKLYGKERVMQAYESGNMYDALKDPIDKSRQHYKSRMGDVVDTMPDFFHEELVRMLCNGDESKLGPNYPA